MLIAATSFIRQFVGGAATSALTLSTLYEDLPLHPHQPHTTLDNTRTLSMFQDPC